MERKKLACMVTAEPTTRPEGVLIRRILRGELEAEPGTIAYLFSADRFQHLYGTNGMLEALDEGKIVLCDRYALSSLAYQGIACGNDLPELLNSRFPAPGLTLFFRVRPETAMERVALRDHLEIYEKLHFQEQVSEAYEETLAEAGKKGWNIVSIDAEKSIEEVTDQVFAALDRHLGIRLG